jgi:hypothetical protein
MACLRFDSVASLHKDINVEIRSILMRSDPREVDWLRSLKCILQPELFVIITNYISIVYK